MAGLACLAVALAGPAHADDLNTMTCSEQQIMTSLQQNDPIIWGKISRDPKVTSLEQTLGYSQWAGVSADIMDSANGPIGRAVNNCHSA